MVQKRNALGEFKIRINRKVKELYGETNIIGVVGWDGRAWRSTGPIASIGLATSWKPDTRRPRGQPRQQWKDITKDVSSLRVNCRELAQDRDKWSQVVVAAMDLNGP